MLSDTIKGKNNKSNVQQIAFAYSYIVAVSFLYKYTHFVDLNNETYVQNADIKEILGYNRNTKTIDKVIKKDGILDLMGITRTTKNYPIYHIDDLSNSINGIPIRELTYIEDIEKDDGIRMILKDIVRNRNYEIKEPLFMSEAFGNRDYSTIYSYESTHKITLDEFIDIIFDEETNNVDFLLYCYFKCKCKGFKKDTRMISLNTITRDTGMDSSTFYRHISILKERKYIDVEHKGWQTDFNTVESNDYCWKGIS